ncbi:hypothetical protein FOMPIDRAFT_1155952 [Fomitopsis schrenkii]|uniref:Xylanolytic transcriptional activator regulatory domain-containing protein n=1 Tax=Fomitopsis schrenkii TaxID=2126942 RepID=S8EJE7_FOMSC|nr:hypothetical protein FOMPIDRAFT_1155952 [Fomitopsis schrenkii]
MSVHQDYRDGGPPAKRPRQDDLTDDGGRPYSLAGPSVHPEADASIDASSKRNRKRPLSCGECRRSHICQCDRVFPCQSCCKRGCAEICPDGALTGGKGSRFILANTEQLHEKIKSMSERIRSLEDALQQMQSQHSSEPHPLLRQELLAIKRSPELFGVERERNGAHQLHGQDHRRDDDDHLGASSSTSPGVLHDEVASSSNGAASSLSHLGIPDDIARLSRSCPFPELIQPELNPAIRQRIRDLLPDRAEGQRVAEQARRNAFWHYSPDTSESFIPNLVHSVYTTPTAQLLPHRLSLFLMILAMGTVVDLEHTHSSQDAERYHQLARAALCETSVLHDPSIDTISALFYMVWYMLMFTNMKGAPEHAWGIMGLLAKLAQSLGLHRDGVGKMIPEELDKRKALLWNMMSVDVRLALMLRRPPSIHIRHVDVKQPAYNFFGSPCANVISSYHEWRDQFFAHCQYPVAELINATQPPLYSEVLELDSKIRDFEIPPLLRMVDNDGVAPPHPVGMQQAMTQLNREQTILNLHRAYFMSALKVSMKGSNFPLKHKYAPAILATFQAAANAIWTLNTCYQWEPELCMRISVLWQNCTSCTLALCLLLGRIPDSPLSAQILNVLDSALRLFHGVAPRCDTAAKLLQTLEPCIDRSRTIYRNWRTGSTESWNEHDADPVCSMAARSGIFSSASSPPVALREDNPFEHAHHSLRRCYDRYIAAVPADFVDPYPGPMEASVGLGMTQTYSTSAERTASPPDLGHSSSSGDGGAAQNAYMILGSDSLDSGFMSWL